MMQRGSYKSHKFVNSPELNNLINMEKPIVTRDRSYIFNLDVKIKLKLDSFHIYDYIDFVEAFYTFGFKNEKIKQFLNGFALFYNSLQYINNDQKIKWLKPRICKQSNSCEKNLIFTLLSYKYKSQLLDYLNIFLSAEIIEIEKRNQFINEFKNKIQLVENQAENIENNKNEPPISNSFPENIFPALEINCDDDYFEVDNLWDIYNY